MKVFIRLVLLSLLSVVIVTTVYLSAMHNLFDNMFGSPTDNADADDRRIECVYSLGQKVFSEKFKSYAFAWIASCERRNSQSPFTSEATYVYVSAHDSDEITQDILPEGQLVAISSTTVRLSWAANGLQVTSSSIDQKAFFAGNIPINFN